jgi:hypothetical protein
MPTPTSGPLRLLIVAPLAGVVVDLGALRAVVAQVAPTGKAMVINIHNRRRYAED